MQCDILYIECSRQKQIIFFRIFIFFALSFWFYSILLAPKHHKAWISWPPYFNISLHPLRHGYNGVGWPYFTNITAPAGLSNFSWFSRFQNLISAMLRTAHCASCQTAPLFCLNMISQLQMFQIYIVDHAPEKKQCSLEVLWRGARGKWCEDGYLQAM